MPEAAKRTRAPGRRARPVPFSTAPFSLFSPGQYHPASSRAALLGRQRRRRGRGPHNSYLPPLPRRRRARSCSPQITAPASAETGGTVPSPTPSWALPNQNAQPRLLGQWQRSSSLERASHHESRCTNSKEIPPPSSLQFRERVPFGASRGAGAFGRRSRMAGARRGLVHSASGWEARGRYGEQRRRSERRAGNHGRWVAQVAQAGAPCGPPHRQPEVGLGALRAGLALAPLPSPLSAGGGALSRLLVSRGASGVRRVVACGWRRP